MRKTNRDILTLQTDKHAKRQKGNQAINLWRNLNMDGQMDVLLKNLTYVNDSRDINEKKVIFSKIITLDANLFINQFAILIFYGVI